MYGCMDVWMYGCLVFEGLYRISFMHMDMFVRMYAYLCAEY
jgi:hypothetical protein